MSLKACISALKSALDEKSWSEDPDRLEPHLTEWRDKYFGESPLLLMPATTAQVSEAVKICSHHGVAIMPQGGNTGLVGGNTPQGEILLSTKRLNTIRSVSAADNLMIAEAGATLLAVQEAADQAARKFPLSLASEGTCTIGGNLSTNAGGVHVVKYGTAKDQVMGIEAVLPDGSIYNGLTALKKDNTGYDLSRLFLGAEGTLGVITAAALRLRAKPVNVQRAMIGVKSVSDALRLLELCQSPALSMFEIVPRLGIKLVIDHIPNQRDPFSDPQDWYVLIDWEFYGGQDDGSAHVEDLLTRAHSRGLISDAVLAQNKAQAAQLLALREHMSAAQKFNGGSIKMDVSVPVSALPEFFARADKACAALIAGCRPVGFGHLGDGNIHYNVAQPVGMDKQAYLDRWDDLTAVVHDIVCNLGGSISAEHGIGIMKKEELAARGDPVKLAMMRSLKQTLDPKGIMNPRVLI